MGLFDLPEPLFTWLDHAVASVLPPAGRLVLWGLAAAALSMALYSLLSPQQRLRHVRDAAVEARRALDRFEGSLSEARPLMAAMFATSLRQVVLVLAPAVLASLPVIFILVWLHGTFAYVVPEGARDLDLRTQPAGYDATLGTAPRAQEVPTLVVRDGRGQIIEQRPLSTPVPVLHKKQWWNTLIANPLGYLAADSPLERVEIDLPRREVLSFGPWWLRTWEFVFFTCLVAVSIAIKLLFRLV